VIGGGVGIALAGPLGELGVGVGSARAEAVVPDVEGLQRRPSRFSINFATRGTSGEERICSSMARTRASGISRFSLKRRSMRVGAVGE
jgi:hypothetical protein